MIYRMVSSLAQFTDDYKCMKEVVLNSTTFEASSMVHFAGQPGGFHTHPIFIDSLTQSAGFIMNANDNSNLDTTVFVNHGWKSFTVFRPLDLTRKYSTFLRLEEKADKAREGDVIVLDGGTIVAIFKGVTVCLLSLNVYRYCLF